MPSLDYTTVKVKFLKLHDGVGAVVFEAGDTVKLERWYADQLIAQGIVEEIGGSRSWLPAGPHSR